MSGKVTLFDWPSHQRSPEYDQDQHPFAILLGCSDSRAPLQLIFDQGVGDLFVVRVAGNIVAPSQLGSIEYAVYSFGTPLILVLGHSGCGAVGAAVDVIRRGLKLPSPSLEVIADRIRPVVERLEHQDPAITRNELWSRAVGENVRFVVNQLTEESEILSDRVKSGKLMIVGAEYSLESGDVTFFPGGD